MLRLKRTFKLTRKRHKTGQKGFAIGAVIVSILILSGIGASMSPIWSTASRTAVLEKEAQEAFYVAQGGLQYVLAKEFFTSMDFSTASTVSNKTLGDGQFSASFSNLTETTAVVTVTSNVGGSERVLRQSISMLYPVNLLSYGAGDTDITGPGTINGDMGGGGTVAISGDVTVNGDITQGMSQTVPDVNFDDMADTLDAQGDRHEGDLVITGFFFDSVHATGDVTIEDGALIMGTVVADGDVTMGDNLWVSGHVAAGGNMDATELRNSRFGPPIFFSDPFEGQPVLQSKGDMALASDGLGTFITGVILSEGDISIVTEEPHEGEWGEVLYINGAIYGQGDITLDINEHGYLWLNYDNASMSSLVQNGNVRLETWQEL